MGRAVGNIVIFKHGRSTWVMGGCLTGVAWLAIIIVIIIVYSQFYSLETMAPWKRRHSRDLVYGTPVTPDSPLTGTWTPGSDISATPRRGLFAKSLLTRFRRSSDTSDALAATPESVPLSVDQLSHSIKEILAVQKAPHVKLYSFSQSQTHEPMVVAAHECAVCDESIQHKLTLESIRVLRCGHLIHEQCLTLVIEYEMQMQQSCEIAVLHTFCSHCNATIALKNHHELPELAQAVAGAWRLSLTSNTTTLEVARESMLQHQVTAEMVQVVRSPLPVPTLLTFHDYHHSNVTYEAVVELYTRYMLRRAPSMPLQLLETLGDMRMADQLHVSVNGDEYLPSTVFLFADHIVVVPDTTVDDGEEMYHVISLAEPEIDINVTGIIVIRPGDDLTPTASSGSLATSCGSLVEVCLASEADQVIQKWVIGVIDGTMEFPSDLFSSTINLETASVR